MDKAFILPLCFFLIFNCLSAPVEMTNAGALLFEHSNNQLHWFLFAKNGERLTRMTDRNFAGNPGKNASSSIIKGVWRTAVGDLQAAVSLDEKGPGIYRYKASFQSRDGITANLLAPIISIPVSSGSRVLEVDGQELRLPEQYKKVLLYNQSSVQARELCFQTGEVNISIKGRFGLRIQDDRQYKQEVYSVRFIIPVEGNDIRDSQYEFSIEVRPIHFQTVDISSAANMGFADEVADDAAGGWTDQGPMQDLRELKSGLQKLAGVEYSITDPVKNNGRSCIVVCNPRFRRYPAYSGIELPVGSRGKYLYLLHAAAWPPKNGQPVGTIRLTYEDGLSRDVQVLNGTDCGNWWRPVDLPNAKVAFSYDCNGETLGLYSSAFPLEDKALKKIEFQFAEHTVWMIAAATIANQKVLMPQPQPYLIKEGKDWSKLETTPHIQDASPLDFSGWLDAPAGKHGRIIVKDGHFALEHKPEQRIRFIGVNVCNQHCFMPHDKIDEMVKRICKLGYNSVRLHHIDRKLIDPKAQDTFTFEPEKLDELNYLFFKCKEAGLYISIDLYSLRAIKPGDGITEFPSSHSGFEIKSLIPLSEGAMNSWKRYAAKLLTGVNPYTGMTWAEDPALYSLNLVNEGSLPGTYSRFPKLMDILDNAYEKDMRQRNVYSPELFRQRGKDFYDFLVRMEDKALKEMITYTRDELKFNGLITNYNFNSRLYQLPLREQLDVIDNHSYLDHPTYPRNQWKLPAYFRQKSSLEEFGLVPGRLGASREFGKPYILTEIQFCNPNRYRSEAGTLFAAIVSLQDYDAYYRFSYADSFEISEPRFFAIDNEPVSQLTEKMLYFLFGRGDLAPAVPAVAMTWNDAWLQKQPNITNEFPSEFYPLALYGRIGNLREGRVIPGVTALPIGENWEKALPSGFAEALKKVRDGGIIKSSTDQVESEPSVNRIKIVTSCSEAFSLPTGEMKGKVLSVSGVDTFSTISLHSLDALPLEQSKKMLFFHITNTASTGMTFYDDKCNLLEDWGKLPLLVKNSRVKVRLNLNPADQIKIETLNWDGSVKKAVETSVNNGGMEFNADTHGGNMIYYISRP